jgi:hypothetical protein
MLIKKVKIDGKKVRLVKGQGLAKDDIMIAIGLWIFLSHDLRLMTVVDATPLNNDLVPPGDVIEGNTLFMAYYY